MASSDAISAPALPVIDPQSSTKLTDNERLFMNEEERQKLKAYTCVLRRCEEVTKKQARGKVLKITDETGKRKYKDLYNSTQRKVNLLVRNFEILASGITLAQVKPEGIEAQAIIINSENDPVNITLGNNPRKEEHITTGNELKIFLSANTEPQSNMKPETDIVEYVMQQYAATQKGRRFVHFRDHVGCFMFLLRRGYEAQTEEDLEHAQEQLRTYVFTVSHPKMYRRLELGMKNGRKLYDTLCQMPKTPTLSDRFDHDFIPPKSFLLAFPTTDQLEILQRAAKDRFQVAADGPVYDTTNRRLLQISLSASLQYAQTCLLKLRMSMGFQLMNTNQFNETLTRGDEIKKEVEEAKAAVSYLNTVITSFDDPDHTKSVLMEHLQWLAKSSQESSEHSSEMIIDREEKVVLAEESTNYNADAMDIDVSEYQPEQGDNDEGDELDASGQAHAMRKYLHLICSHEKELCTEFDSMVLPEKRNPAQAREAILVVGSKISVVDIQQAKVDGQRWSLNTTLAHLIQTQVNGPLKAGPLRIILGPQGEPQPGKESVLDRTDYPGSLHAESILLSLAYILHDEQLSKHITSEWLEHNGIFATRTDLLEMFKDRLPFLAVSKGCCLLCKTICKRIAESGVLKGDKDFVLPGEHTEWFPSTVPSFLPLKIAEQVLSDVEGEVRDRLADLQTKYEEATNSSCSLDSLRSYASHPSSTPASARKKLPMIPIPEEDIEHAASKAPGKRLFEQAEMTEEETARMGHEKFDNTPANIRRD